MPNINDRIGSQNVIRVLSNAAAPPTKLINLSDVDSTLKTVDGMILVWDLPTEKFIMTSVIDSSSTTIKGIAFFDNTRNSSLPTNGALIVSGGVGIGKNLNVAGDIVISGISTFSSNLDINAAVDILNGLVVNGNFRSVGITTLAANGGITTTGGNLYVGGDLYVAGKSNFKNNVTVTGFVTVTEGIYYDFGDYDGPNGVAYFNNSGKLVGAASTENAVNTSNFILTTDAVGIPTWTSVIDGGEF